MSSEWTPQAGEVVRDTVSDMSHSEGTWRFVTDPQQIWPSHTERLLPSAESVTTWQAAWELLLPLCISDKAMVCVRPGPPVTAEACTRVVTDPAELRCMANHLEVLQQWLSACSATILAQSSGGDGKGEGTVTG